MNAPLSNLEFYLDCQYNYLTENSSYDRRTASIFSAYHNLINSNSCPVRYHGDIVACYTMLLSLPEVPNTVVVAIRQSGVEIETNLERYLIKSNVFGVTSADMQWHTLRFIEFYDHNLHYSCDDYVKQVATFVLATDEEIKEYFNPQTKEERKLQDKQNYLNTFECLQKPGL